MLIPTEMINVTTQSNFQDQTIPLENNQSLTPKITRQLNLQNVRNPELQKEIGFILFNLLNYPSINQANIHQQAQRLGDFDMKKKEKGNFRSQYCKCCGLIKQNQGIPLCTHLDQFPNIGLSTYLYFQTIKNIIILQILLISVYVIFAFTTNLEGYQIDANQNFTFEQFILAGSLKSKKMSTNPDFQNYYLMEMWIGTGMIIIWGFLIYFLKYLEIKNEIMVDSETVSASDFSILIENYPTNLTQFELQNQLSTYEQKIDQKICPLIIEKINLSKPLDFDSKALIERQLQDIDNEYHKMIERFAEWIQNIRGLSDFKVSKSRREKAYKKFEQIKQKRQKAGKTLLKLARKRLEKQKYNQSTMAIITFKFSQARDVFLKLNKRGLLGSFFDKICSRKDSFMLFNSKGKKFDYKLRAAPEPEDILWYNLGVSVCEKFMRKLGIYFATLALLSVSFGVVYLLSLAQVQTSHNLALSITISLFIGVINLLIGILIQFLTLVEKDYTETDHQTSLAIKSIFAQLLNSIAVPIIANYYIEGNIYNENGLAFDVFYIALFTSFLPPIVKLIYPKYIFYNLKAWWNRRIYNRIKLKQNQLNVSQQMPQFELGYQSIPILDSFLFTSFFISLQPIIITFSIVGMILLYWIQKYNVLNRVKRPIPGTSFINDAMFQLISLGPLFYSLGAITWSHLLDTPSTTAYSLPNLISLGLGVTLFIFPFHTIFENCCFKQQRQQLDYEKSKLLLNSEYDRLNPVTMQEAMKKYEEYLEEMKKKVVSENENLQNSFANFLKINQTSSLDVSYLERKKAIVKNKAKRNNSSLFGVLSEFDEKVILNNLFHIIQKKSSEEKKKQTVEQFLPKNCQHNFLKVKVTQKKPKAEETVLVEDIIEEKQLKQTSFEIDKKDRASTTKIHKNQPMQHEHFFASNVDLDKGRATPITNQKQREKRQSKNFYLHVDF